MNSWRSTNGRSGRIRRYAEGTSSVHDNLDEYCRNPPLQQQARAVSTINGVLRRSSDQMHQQYPPKNSNRMQARSQLSYASKATLPSYASVYSNDGLQHEVYYQPSRYEDGAYVYRSNSRQYSTNGQTSRGSVRETIA
jgi:hypothetical protein